MKKIIPGIIALFILILVSIILSKTLLKPHTFHIHAGFQVYNDEKLVDFSDFKYMHEAPCTVDGKPLKDAPVDEQLEKAHLHDHAGDVVHVHRKGALWKDLFANIKYPIDENAAAYINGKKTEKFLEKKIVPYDSLVVFEGSHTDDKKFLKNAVGKERIQEVEKKSETCSG